MAAVRDHVLGILFLVGPAWERRLGGALPEPGEAETSSDGPVVCRERLGGLLRSYHREAA